MAYSRTVRTAFTNGGSSVVTTAVSGTSTPANNSWILLLVAQGQAGATNRDHTISDTFLDTGGGAWAKIATGTVGGDFNMHAAAWQRKIGTSAALGAITITRTNATNTAWDLFGQAVEFTGLDTTTPFKQTIDNTTAGNRTTAFSPAPQSTSYVCGLALDDGGGEGVPGAGWTKIQFSGLSNVGAGVQTQEDNSPPPQSSCVWSSGFGGVNTRIVIVEALEPAAASGPVLQPPLQKGGMNVMVSM